MELQKTLKRLETLKIMYDYDKIIVKRLNQQIKNLKKL